MAEDQARRLDEYASRHASGAGLGLSLVREMDALGGRIALESRPGAESTFTVTLPSERGEPPRAQEPWSAPARR